MKKKQIGIPLEKVLKEKLKNTEFKFFFEQEQAITHIAHLVRSAREKIDMTQSELAHRAETTQAVIARLESGKDSRVPSLGLLQRIAKALKARLLISFDYQTAA